ncbi:hypothetical protein CBM2634_B160093 [Cupriavidus taiwanensis]|uniref:Uncharacterized protein n=1 Tax=Cupriavidus taiwanensis TaxID=164546 RepID=A0A375J538_9BURK|nr:hypothetical protein CBM2634_B160093 [Cupriavidus taiwanensis]
MNGRRQAASDHQRGKPEPARKAVWESSKYAPELERVTPSLHCWGQSDVLARRALATYNRSGSLYLSHCDSISMRDRSLDTLLDLDGLLFVIDDESLHWVKIVVRTCPVSQERPHGLRYSLTLHDRMGCRLLGFDNAHGINEGSGPGVADAH